MNVNQKIMAKYVNKIKNLRHIYFCDRDLIISGNEGEKMAKSIYILEFIGILQFSQITSHI